MKSVLIPISVTWTLYILPITILTLYISFNNEQDPCQKGRSAGLYLSEWLKVAGFTDILILTIYWLFVVIEYICNPELGTACYALAVYISIFVQMVIRIIGIVILATPNNSTCVSIYNQIGMMAIVNIVLCYITCALGFKNTFVTEH
jgi:hypothetical protein